MPIIELGNIIARVIKDEDGGPCLELIDTEGPTLLRVFGRGELIDLGKLIIDALSKEPAESAQED